MDPLDIIQRQHYYDLFIDEVEHLTQQMTSKFMGGVLTRSGLTGETVRTRVQYGKTSTNKNRKGRGLDTPQNDTARSNAWYSPNVYDWGDLLENEDEVRKLGQSQNGVITSARAAFARDVDDEILDAFFGSVLRGELKAEATVAFPASANDILANVGGGGTDTGMNVQKLMAIRTRFQSANFDVDLDQEELNVGISPQMEEELLNDQRFTSNEFTKGTNNRLESAVLDGFMRFNFTVSNRIVTSGGNYTAPVWVKSGMEFGSWAQEINRIAEAPGKRFRTQIYLERRYGAVRLQDTKVLRLLSKV